jgi:hypothetical protein
MEAAATDEFVVIFQIHLDSSEKPLRHAAPLRRGKFAFSDRLRPSRARITDTATYCYCTEEHGLINNGSKNFFP